MDISSISLSIQKRLDHKKKGKRAGLQIISTVMINYSTIAIID
jgi:hypothetical protein